MGQKVDTWRSRKSSDGRKVARKRMLVPSLLSTVDLVQHSALPVNVMECDDRLDEGEQLEEQMLEQFGEDEMEISELEPVKDDEVMECRFHVCQQRVDEDGNLVLELEERGGEDSQQEWVDIMTESGD